MGEEINYSETTNLAEKENIFSFFHLPASRCYIKGTHEPVVIISLECHAQPLFSCEGELKLDLN